MGTAFSRIDDTPHPVDSPRATVGWLESTRAAPLGSPYSTDSTGGILPATEWLRATPSAPGLDPERLAELAEVIPQQAPGLRSLVIIQDGKLVMEVALEPHSLTTEREVYSITKSIMATLIGIAIDQGYIEGVDAPVLDYFAERTIDNNSAAKQAILLDDLLTMTSGILWVEDYNQAIRDLRDSPDWLQTMLDLPMATQPGERFNYCTGCSHLLSGILERATGMDAFEFAQQNLFAPLGITQVQWSRDTGGTPIGGWGIQLSPYDLARFGYLYLQGGRWGDQQIVSAAWVETATSPHITVDDDYSYGYQWWIRSSIEGYAAIGADGQMVAVLPEKNVVVVFTSSYGQTDVLFELIEQYIY